MLNVNKLQNFRMLNKEAIVKQSAKQIRLYLMEIVNSIMQSKTASPFGIRKVCAMIFDLVQTTFPEKPVGHGNFDLDQLNQVTMSVNLESILTFRSKMTD